MAEIYNEEGIKKWIRESELVTSEIDRCRSGNIYEERVYRKDGQLYVLSFCNRQVCSRWTDDKGYKRGEYQPIPVTVTEKIEEIRYTQKVIKYKNSDGATMLRQERVVREED